MTYGLALHSGLLRYNRDTDDFTRMPELANMFVYKILEILMGICGWQLILTVFFVMM